MMRFLGAMILAAVVATPLVAQVPRIPTVPPPPPNPAITQHCDDDSGCPFPGGIIPEHTNAAPSYPLALRDRGGTVRVTFAVSPDGMVESGSVRVTGDADSELASAVTSVVSRWQFTVLGSARRASNIPVRLTVEFVASPSCAGERAAAAWVETRTPRLRVTGCPAGS